MSRAAESGPVHALCELDERVATARKARDWVRLAAALRARAGVWSLLSQTMALGGSMSAEGIATAALRCEHAAKLDHEESDSITDRLAGVSR